MMFLPILFILQVYSQPLYQHSLINNPVDSHSITSLKLSADGSMFVIGAFGYKVYIYHEENKKFALTQTLTPTDIYSVFTTSDGQWLVTGNANGTVSIRTKENKNRFTPNQTLQVEDSKVLSLFLTDDFKMLGIGTQSGKISIYEFTSNNNEFELFYTIPVGQRVSSLAFSQNHSLLVAASDDFVKVYKKGVNSYDEDQSLNYSKGGWKTLSLTLDSSYLVVSNYEHHAVDVYTYGSNKFSLSFSRNQTLYPFYSSISANKKYLLISAASGSFIYELGNSSPEQKLPGSWFNSWSNSEFVVVGNEKQIIIYSYCDYQQNGRVYNDEKQECDLCQIQGCMECSSATSCSVCTDDYQLVNGQCSTPFPVLGLAMIGIVVVLLIAILVLACCARSKLKSSQRYRDDPVNNPSQKNIDNDVDG